MQLPTPAPPHQKEVGMSRVEGPAVARAHPFHKEPALVESSPGPRGGGAQGSREMG